MYELASRYFFCISSVILFFAPFCGEHIATQTPIFLFHTCICNHRLHSLNQLSFPLGRTCTPYQISSFFMAKRWLNGLSLSFQIKAARPLLVKVIQHSVQCAIGKRGHVLWWLNHFFPTINLTVLTWNAKKV